jgi:hypothetical protein
MSGRFETGGDETSGVHREVRLDRHENLVESGSRADFERTVELIGNFRNLSAESAIECGGSLHALAANSLGSREEGLRATWGWSEWPFPPATQQQTPRAESYAQHRPQLKVSRFQLRVGLRPKLMRRHAIPCWDRAPSARWPSAKAYAASRNPMLGSRS